MELNYFAYITGIASVLGLALQVFDIFPTHAGFRKSIFLLVLGIFLGTLLNTFDASHIIFDVKLSGFTLLMSVFAFAILGFLVAGALMRDRQRRAELFIIGCGGFIAFVFVLFVGSLWTSDISYPTVEKKRLTVSELIDLSDSA